MKFLFRESLGVAYPPTLVSLPVSADVAATTKSALVDGKAQPFYIASDGSLKTSLSLAPFQERVVELSESPAEIEAPKASFKIISEEKTCLLQLPNATLRLPCCSLQSFFPPQPAHSAPAPICEILATDGSPLASGMLDIPNARVKTLDCSLTNSDPLYTAFSILYTFDNGGAYEFKLSVSCIDNILHITEKANTDVPKARFILEFPQREVDPTEPLPTLALADHSLFYSETPLCFFSDRLQARLYPWTQASQIAKLREGFQFTLPGIKPVDVAFFVSDCSSWDGMSNNFVELWERRLPHGDPIERGGETQGSTFSYLPPDSPHSDPGSSPALCLETPLTKGRRSFCMAFGSTDKLRLPSPLPEHTLEWYEGPALLEEWSASRSFLRTALQTKGLFSLNDFLSPSYQEPSTRFNELGMISSHIALHQSFPGMIHKALEKPEENMPLILRYMHNTLDVLASGFVAARGPGGSNPVTMRPVYPLAIVFRELMLKRLIPEQDAKLFFAQFNFLKNLTACPFYYPGEYTMLPFGDPRSSEPACLGMPNENFLTDIFCLFGGLALVFPWHPDSAAQLERANSLLSLQLDTFCDPRSGIWEESHTYYHHVLRTLAIFALEQQVLFKYASSKDIPIEFRAQLRDWFADERFIRLCRAALLMVTPNDPTADGLRMLPTLGDHRRELHWHSYAALARGFFLNLETIELAHELSWLSEQNGYKGHLHVPPKAPTLSSTKLEGLGAILRYPNPTRPETGSPESFVLLRAGYTWGHHNCDEQEVLYTYLNDPILVEAGYGNPKTFEKIGATGHSIVTPKDFTPAFYLARCNRGILSDYAPTSNGGSLAASRIIAYEFNSRSQDMLPIPITPYKQTRRVSWTASDSEASLVIEDSVGSSAPQRVFFHTAARRVEKLPSGEILLIGDKTKTTLKTEPALDFNIVPDASGLTTGLVAEAMELPTLKTTLRSTIRNA